ncbi:MAG: sulfur oxidation c-type cytochrome SoxX [Pseudomonadota bacterium]
MKHALVLGLSVGLGASIAAADDITPTAVTFEEGAVSASLTGVAGDADSGRKIFANRKQGNCLACHVNPDMPEESFHGEVGPPMDGVAERWSVAELRGIVSNSKQMFPGTIMPAFYVDAGYNRPLDDFTGKSILTAQQVEDVVAYLTTLKYE